MKANSPWVFLPLVGFVLLAVLTLSACADEQERGRKWCRKAAQVAGSSLQY